MAVVDDQTVPKRGLAHQCGATECNFAGASDIWGGCTVVYFAALLVVKALAAATPLRTAASMVAG